MRRALFWLAQDLGMSVARVEREVSAAELREWLAFWRVEPRWNPWWGLAHVLAMIANLFRDKKSAARKAEEFLPRGMRPERKSPAAMRAAFALFAAGREAS